MARVFVEADIKHQGMFGAEVGRRQHEFMTRCIVSYIARISIHRK
jgi:hypothetical protein